MDNHILLTGGGTLGPVTPLLALVEEARKNNRPYRFTWIGTSAGPEKVMVEAHGLAFRSIVSGRWRRYFSWHNFTAPFEILMGFFQAYHVLRADRPILVVTVGAYVSVPVVYAAWFLRVPTLLYEIDIERTLANRFILPVVSARASSVPREGAKTMGAVVRPSVLLGDETIAREAFQVPPNVPVVLVTGGGTGALALNRLLLSALSRLVEEAVVIHLMGKGKREQTEPTTRYIPLEYVDRDMPHLLAAATLVVSRAGMGTISELAVLKKTTVLVPLPDSPQEANAAYAGKHEAAVVFAQNQSSDTFADTVVSLLKDPRRSEAMASELHQMLPYGTDSFLQYVDEIIKAHG